VAVVGWHGSGISCCPGATCRGGLACAPGLPWVRRCRRHRRGQSHPVRQKVDSSRRWVPARVTDCWALAPPVENLDSGRYGGDTLAPPITGVSLISAGDNYRPVPGATGGHPFPAPPNRSPLNASVSIPEQTSGGDETPGVSEVLSDVTPDNYWIPGADYAADGHHHNPRGVYRKLPLPEETRKVFDKATTGSLPFYKWHEYDELHRMYNDAVEELMSRFMKEHGVKAEQMTPDHARAVLKAIAESNEPRIRVYRSMLQLMGRLYRLRSGARGNE